MTDARAWLDQVDARTNAATDGPWRADSHVDMSAPGYEVYRAPADGGYFGTQGWVAWTGKQDAEFIAHARTDLPAATTALRAVLDLHQEDLFRGHLSNGCKVCDADYPCQTVKAVTTALEDA